MAGGGLGGNPKSKRIQNKRRQAQFALQFDRTLVNKGRKLAVHRKRQGGKLDKSAALAATKLPVSVQRMYGFL